MYFFLLLQKISHKFLIMFRLQYKSINFYILYKVFIFRRSYICFLDFAVALSLQFAEIRSCWKMQNLIIFIGFSSHLAVCGEVP